MSRFPVLDAAAMFQSTVTRDQAHMLTAERSFDVCEGVTVQLYQWSYKTSLLETHTFGGSQMSRLCLNRVAWLFLENFEFDLMAYAVTQPHFVSHWR